MSAVLNTFYIRIQVAVLLPDVATHDAAHESLPLGLLSHVALWTRRLGKLASLQSCFAIVLSGLALVLPCVRTSHRLATPDLD